MTNLKDCLARSAPDLLHLWPTGGDMNTPSIPARMDALLRICEARNWTAPASQNVVEAVKEVCARLEAGK